MWLASLLDPEDLTMNSWLITVMAPMETMITYTSFPGYGSFVKASACVCMERATLGPLVSVLQFGESFVIARPAITDPPSTEGRLRDSGTSLPSVKR